MKWYGHLGDEPVLIQEIGVVPPGEDYLRYPLDEIERILLDQL